MRYGLVVMWLVASACFAADVPQLSSKFSPSGCFAIATFRNSNGKVLATTSIYDWADEEVCSVGFGIGLSPQTLMVGRQAFLFDDDDDDGGERTFLSFRLIGSAVAKDYLIGEKSFDFDDDLTIQSPLRAALGNARPLLTKSIEPLNPTTEMVSYPIHDEFVFDKGRALVWYRSPAEEAFFGYPVRAATVMMAGFRQIHFNFQADTDSGSVARLDHGSIRGHEINKENRAELLKAAASCLARRDHSRIAQAMDPQVVLRILKDEEALADSRRLLGILRKFRDYQDGRFNDGHSVFFDPYMRNFSLEQELWPGHGPSITHRLETSVAKFGARDPLYLALLSNWCDLGYSVHSETHTPLLHGAIVGEFPFGISAVILTKFAYPITSDHAQALKRIATTDPHEENRQAAMEALVAADAVEYVPEKALSSWFDGVTKDSNQIRKLRVISLFMLGKNGRNFLAEHALSLPQGDHLKRLICSVFENEIRCARNKNNFNYVTEEECETYSARLGLSVGEA